MEHRPLNLALFGQEGGGAPDASGQPEKPVQPEPSEQPAHTHGAQAQDARKRFDQLIQGEYKQEYQRRLKAQLDRRFRAYEQRKRAQDQLLSTLARRYGLEGESPQDLARALGREMDKPKARESGRGPEQRPSQAADLTKSPDREGEKAPEEPRGADAPQPGEAQAQAPAQGAGAQGGEEGQADKAAGLSPQALAQLRARSIYQDWQRQAAAARQVYPGLDLGREMAIPRFRQLMRAGAGVREAYEVVHRDQVLGGAMAYAARTMARKVGNALAAQAARPPESGAGQSPATRPVRPEELTDQQVLEVARQARKGRRIPLN